MKAQKKDACELCQRHVSLTFHHLVPKKYHDNRTVRSKFENIDLIHYGSWLCNDCHKQVHRLISLKDLANDFNTLEKLRNHEDIMKFAHWAAKQTKKIKR